MKDLLLELVTSIDIIFFAGGTNVERVCGHVVMVGGCLATATICGWFLL